MTTQRDRSSEIVLNLPELLIRVENDRDLLRELVAILKEEFPRLLLQLQGSVGRGDLKSVETICHGLRGMLAGLSAMPAADVAARIEQMARHANASELSPAVKLLEHEMEILLPELDASVKEAEA